MELALLYTYKNNYLVLGEGPADDINSSVGTVEKNLSIKSSKANTYFCLRLHCNGDNSYFFVNGIEIYKFKADNKIVNFPAQFCLGRISLHELIPRFGSPWGTKHNTDFC